MHMELACGIMVVRLKTKTPGAADYFEATVRNIFAVLGVPSTVCGVLHLDEIAWQ